MVPYNYMSIIIIKINLVIVPLGQHKHHWGGSWTLKHNIMQPIWGVITQQVIPSNGFVDNWLWSGTNSGKFNFKSAWDIVRVCEPPYVFLEVIWCHCHNPKMGACLLRFLQLKLLTRNFLKSFGIADSDVCFLCHKDQDNIQHLFFKCHFSAYIWSLCKLKLGLNGVGGKDFLDDVEQEQIRSRKRSKIVNLS